jgi:hypothetical protein
LGFFFWHHLHGASHWPTFYHVFYLASTTASLVFDKCVFYFALNKTSTFLTHGTLGSCPVPHKYRDLMLIWRHKSLPQQHSQPKSPMYVPLFINLDVCWGFFFGKQRYSIYSIYVHCREIYYLLILTRRSLFFLCLKLLPMYSTCVDECDWLFHCQHKL